MPSRLANDARRFGVLVAAFIVVSLGLPAGVHAGVRVAYTATCMGAPLGCGGFSVRVMDEHGGQAVMVQDCFVDCQGTIPASSVSYGPRTPGQHSGAFSDDDPAAGRRFAI